MPLAAKPHPEVLKAWAEVLWEKFVEADVHLVNSTCTCCEEKRDLRRLILHESYLREREEQDK